MKLRFFLFWMGLIILVGLVIEAGSFLVFPILFGHSLSLTEISNQRHFITNKISSDSNRVTPELVFHPYFGVVANPNYQYAEGSDSKRPPVNIFDLPDELPQFGTKQNPDDFIIGISGGSVAQGVIVEAKQILISELKKFSFFKSKNIRVVGLAFGGYKQPQQLMIISYLISLGAHFDAIVNLDGLNELALPFVDQLPNGVHWTFPRQWRVLNQFAAGNDSTEEFIELKNLLNQRRFLAKYFDFLKWSTTANLAWKVIDQRILKDLVEEQAKERPLPSRSNGRISPDGYFSMGPPNKVSSQRDFFIEVSSMWMRSSLQIHKIVELIGGRYYHFLQPNQYFPHSKIVSREEKIIFSQGIPFSKAVENGYPYLRVAGELLKKQGIDFTDLSLLFKDESRTMYVDSCCHFNKAGYSALASSIANRIGTTFSASQKNQIASDLTEDFSQKSVKVQSLQGDDYNDGTNLPIPSDQHGRILRIYKSGKIKDEKTLSVDDLEYTIQTVQYGAAGIYEVLKDVIKVCGWAGLKNPWRLPEGVFVSYENKFLFGKAIVSYRKDIEDVYPELSMSGFLGQFAFPKGSAPLDEVRIFALFPGAIAIELPHVPCTSKK